MAAENFEQVLAAAQAGGSLHPAWKKLVNTKFFVAVIAPADAGAGAYTLRTAGAGQAIRMSEVRERLDDEPGALLAALSGADVVRMAPDGAGIAIALSEQTFDIAASRVAWIRKSIEATLAKAAHAREAAIKPADPEPAPALAPAPAPAAGRLPVLEPMPADTYEDLVFVEEDPPPRTLSLLERIGRKRALAYGLPLLAILGLAGQALLRGAADRPQSVQAFDRGGDGAGGQMGPAGAARNAGAPLASQAWTSPDGGLTIDFPARPDEDTVRANALERMGAARMRQFSVSAHGEDYKVQVLDLGAPPADPEAALVKLQTTLFGSDPELTAPPMELVFKGFPGRDVKAGRRQVRMVVVNATVYIASVDAGVEPASMQRATAFVGSLALNQ